MDLGRCAQVGVGVAFVHAWRCIAPEASAGHLGDPLSCPIWGFQGTRNTPGGVTTKAVSLMGSLEVAGAFCEGVVRLGCVLSKE